MSFDMDGACLQRDLAFGGPRTDGDEQRETDESRSLLHGLGCGAIANVSLFFDSGVFGAGFDEPDSLFGDDADMESLFGGFHNEEEKPQQQRHQALASPLPFLLTLPLPPLPRPLPALPQTGSSERSCDVSTLLPEHQNQQKHAKQAIGPGQNGAEEDGLLLPVSGLDCSLNVDFDFDVDIGLAVELEMARQTQENEQEKTREAEKEAEAPYPSSHQESFVTTATNTFSPASDGADDGRVSLQPPRPGIDTPFHAAGLGTHDDQEGQGPTTNIANSVIDDEDDSDVVILSSRQVPGFVPPPVVMSIPHYLELRPRCPQGPPPARIDLDNYNVEELLPYVQLHSKLSIRGIQDLLGLDVDAGRYIVATCHEHLANPAHAVYMSGSSDPTALRILKVTLILSSLALLKDGDGRAGVGPCWFGRDSPLEPKSMHVWPDDSTTLTLLFIQLLYRLTRNKSARERHRKLNAASPGSTPGKERSPKLSESPEPPKSPDESELKMPEPPNEPKPRKRKRKAPQPGAAPKPLDPPIPAPARLPINLAYSSPRVLRDALLSSNVNRNTTPIRKSDKASPPALNTPSPAAVATYLCPAKRPPADANIRYRVNIVDGRSQQRVVPQIVLRHEGAIRSAGYSYVTDVCAHLGQTVETVSIMTLLGLEQVSSDVGWDRVVGRVHDELLMDGEVRILVCLQN